MKAAVIREFGAALSLEPVADPECPPSGVVLKVLACGVCRSDHHAWQGADPDVTLPHIPGHEFCGEVLATGANVKHWHVGDRVIAPFILGCGTCLDCASGEVTICATQHVPGFTHPGAFAELIAVDRADANLVRLPDWMPPAVGAAMGCRLTTAFRAVVDRASMKSGEWVAVWGCGGVGLSAIQIIKALGGRAIGLDVNPNKLAKAQELGAEHVLNAGDVACALKTIDALTSGGADVALDALGHPTTFDAAMLSLRKMGRLVQIGMPHGDGVRPPVRLDRLYSHQLAVFGTRGLPSHRFNDLMTLIEAGKLKPQNMIEQEIALSGVTKSLEALSQHAGSGVQVVTNFVD